MLNDAESFERLISLGVLGWIKEKKDSGRIRNIGFSYHGGTESFKALLDAYDWDFCQIQYNYLDIHSQAGIAGLNYAYKKGIPVIVMEPLRGGRLAKLPRDAARYFRRIDSSRSDAEWGLRWVLNHPGVIVALSGMNSVSQVEENAAVASDAMPNSLSKKEKAAYKWAIKKLRARLRVGCTGCGYCQPCPQGVDIPNCFSAYNNSYTEGFLVGIREYFMCTILRKNKSHAGLCIGCGACEKRCPQHIAIRNELKEVRRRFGGKAFDIASRLSDKVMKY